MKPIGDLLKQVRRPVDVEPNTTYREIGIRSHCKGIFHKPETTGKKIGNKRVFWVEPGCLVFNIIFAWEQAVAMTSDAEAGMIASHRFPMYCSRNGKLMPEYVWRYFSTPRGKYDLNIASPGGAGRNKTLGQEEFKQLKLPVPPVEYQREVVDVLATTDRAIAGGEKLITAKRTLKKGLAQQLLTGQRRLPGFNYPWSKREVGQLASVSKKRFDPQNGENRRCIELEHLSQGDGCLIGTIDSRGQQSLKAVFSKGNVLFGKLRPNLRKSYLCEFDGVCSTEIWVLQAQTGVCRSEYLAQLVQTERFVAAACITSGSKMPRADWGYVSEIPFDVPNVPEQARIAAVLGAADREIVLLEKKLAALRELKIGLMQKLLSGPVKVKA
jgi:type I restriction enzyme S subunit